MNQKKEKLVLLKEFIFPGEVIKKFIRKEKNLESFCFLKLTKLLDGDLVNTVFSYIPNTAETSFFGLVQEAQKQIKEKSIKEVLSLKENLSQKKLEKLFSLKPRIEKVAIKDAKLRTFISDDANRDELVAHVYDITYGSIKKTDTLVIIDDSIVRGTTLQKSILKILDRLNPKKVIIVSSAPQISYPDCYGIDMAKMEDFIAFRAAISLLKAEGKENKIKKIYKDCLTELKLPSNKMKNQVSQIYSDYSDYDISNQIAKILKRGRYKSRYSGYFPTC